MEIRLICKYAYADVHASANTRMHTSTHDWGARKHEHMCKTCISNRPFFVMLGSLKLAIQKAVRHDAMADEYVVETKFALRGKFKVEIIVGGILNIEFVPRPVARVLPRGKFQSCEVAGRNSNLVCRMGMATWNVIFEFPPGLVPPANDGAMDGCGGLPNLNNHRRIATPSRTFATTCAQHVRCCTMSARNHDCSCSRHTPTMSSMRRLKLAPPRWSSMLQDGRVDAHMLVSDGGDATGRPR